MTYPVDKPPEIASSKFSSKNSLAVAWLSGFNMVSISFNCVINKLHTDWRINLRVLIVLKKCLQ